MLWNMLLLMEGLMVTWVLHEVGMSRKVCSMLMRGLLLILLLL